MKINKPSLNKINFVYNNHILKCPSHYFQQFFRLSKLKIFSSLISPTTYFPFILYLNAYDSSLCFFISLFAPQKIVPVRDRKWEKYSAFLKTFHPEIKCLMQRLEHIKDRIERHEVSILFNQI